MTIAQEQKTHHGVQKKLSGGIERDLIPADYVFQKQTPSFDRSSLPNALKKAHATKAGTWGLIVVEHGKVHYTIDATGDSNGATFTLTPECPGVVAPTERHHVRLDDGDSRFHVEFYAADSKPGD